MLPRPLQGQRPSPVSKEVPSSLGQARKDRTVWQGTLAQVPGLASSSAPAWLWSVPTCGDEAICDWGPL